MNAELTRAEAQQRADDIHAWRREQMRLAAEGLGGADAAAVAAYHEALLAQLAARPDVDTTQRDRQLTLGLRIASFLGALALAASVFFLFRQFWPRLSEALQVAVLAASSLATLGLTAWLHRRDSAAYFTKLAGLVAFVCFVLNLSLLGASFNITPSDKALLPWAAFALLLAYTCELRLLLVAGLICIAAFIAARVGTWSGLYWLDLGERPEHFLPAALAMFCVPLFVDHRRHPGFDATWRVVALLALFLPMLVLANWGRASYLPLPASAVEGVYQIAGFVAGGLLAWLGTRRGWPEVSHTAVTFFVIFLYTKLFDWWWQLMPKFLFFLLLGLVALLVIFVLKRLRAAGVGIPGPVSDHPAALLPDPARPPRLQRRLAVGGVALIVAVNAVVLAGVAWNRSGEPTSRLTLSQRELRLPYAFEVVGERGGLTLALNWRVSHRAGQFYGGAEWLDEAKLRSLGFDLSRGADALYPERQVFIVLELAGPSWEQEVARAQARVDEVQARDGQREQDARDLKSAQEGLALERERASRLFAIDAGRDATALRQRYPEVQRYAIVQGRVRPWVSRLPERTVMSGTLSALAVSDITVPHALSGGFDGLDRAKLENGKGSFEAEVAWGRRFEPWLGAVRAQPAP
ncbi:MAG: DUF4824 family protein [Methyloversatilis sp.]|nr:DUF4824 family protein [Methyloversatilis sp.]